MRREKEFTIYVTTVIFLLYQGNNISYCSYHRCMSTKTM